MIIGIFEKIISYFGINVIYSPVPLPGEFSTQGISSLSFVQFSA